MASRAPNRATSTSSASPSSGTSETATSPDARWAPDTSSHSAAPVPTAGQALPVASGSSSQASTTGTATRANEPSPVARPTRAPRHRAGAQVAAPPSAVRRVVGPREGGAEAVEDGHRAQCARRAPPDPGEQRRGGAR